MAKRLFLLLFSSLLGTLPSSSFLGAADSFTIKQPEFHAVQTVEIEKEEPKEDVFVSTTTTSSTSTVTKSYVAPANHIDIMGKSLEIVEVSSTTVNSGNHVNKFGSRFLYGHNTNNVFRVLYNAQVGSTFSITEDGATTSYQVEKIVIYQKNLSTGELQLDNEGSYMRAVSKAKTGGVQYDMALMTCYGTMYGDDASERLVIFANEI